MRGCRLSGVQRDGEGNLPFRYGLSSKRLFVVQLRAVEETGDHLDEMDLLQRELSQRLAIPGMRVPRWS